VGQVTTPVIVTYDRNGKMVELLEAVGPSVQAAAPDHHEPLGFKRPIWVADNQANQVFKFSNDGKKLLMKLGEVEPANDDKHFHGPTRSRSSRTATSSSSRATTG
jgi:hypothetical protein